MKGWQERIESDEGILRGKPVIRGTRVLVYVVLGSLAGGDSVEGVCEGFRIAEEDVRAALAYAAESVARETVHALPRR
jgi:uncharacterized protein (DUF433 family)